MVMGEAEQLRYSRQTRLPTWGLAAQERLRGASVAVVGAGGLGSPTLMYLAAAGVGRLGVIDDDVIADSNLHRQVIHDTAGIGTPKVASAAARIRALTPYVDVIEHPVRLVAANVREVLGGYDVVVDGSDSFATRYLVNDACLLLGTPLVWASVLGFDGQLSVFGGEGPCLRCLFPVPPAAGEVPSCAEAGVLGVVPGLLGVAQATEAIKLASGVGEPIRGRVAMYDGLTGSWSELPLRKDPRCAGCGEDAAPTLADLVEACAVPERELPPEVLADWLAERRAGRRTFTLVDLREPDEGPVLEGAVRDSLDGLLKGSREGAVVVYCQSGVRSNRALGTLLGEGVDAFHLRGGVRGWLAAGVS